MRLLFGWLFDLEVRRALAHFVLELIACLLELPQALADPTGEFRKLLGSEKQDDHNKNEESLWPTGHTEGDW